MAAPGEGKEGQAPFPSLSDKKHLSGPGATLQLVCGHLSTAPSLQDYRGPAILGLTQGKGREVAQ